MEAMSGFDYNSSITFCVFWQVQPLKKVANSLPYFNDAMLVIKNNLIFVILSLDVTFYRFSTLPLLL